MIGVFAWLVPFAIVAALVYLVVRSRQNQGVTWYQALVSYFYLMTTACVITAAVGAILLVTVFLDLVFIEANVSEEMLIVASVLAGTGLVIGILHVEGRRILQKKTGIPTPSIRRFYLFTMLMLSGIAGLVSLPIATYETIRYYVLDRDYLHFSEAPSGALAAAIVIVLLWAYYLVMVLREPRHKDNNESFGPRATPIAEG